MKLTELMAIHLQDLKDRIEAINWQLHLHLFKILLFNFDKTNLNHWKNEIANFLIKLQTKVKSGKYASEKFYYRYLWDWAEGENVYFEGLSDVLKRDYKKHWNILTKRSKEIDYILIDKTLTSFFKIISKELSHGTLTVQKIDKELEKLI